MSEKFIVAGDDYKNWLKEVKLSIRSVQAQSGDFGQQGAFAVLLGVWCRHCSKAGKCVVGQRLASTTQYRFDGRIFGDEGFFLERYHISQKVVSLL